MKNILVLGAGQSTPYLVSYLLEHAERHDWFVTVGDRDLDLARSRLAGHPRGTGVLFDVNDAELRSSYIQSADLVVNMLPPMFQQLVALDCVYQQTHMVSASYEDRRLKDLDLDANRRGVLILNEMGLDPGIDHMSAMATIQRVENDGGVVRAFKSYGSGLPAPEFSGNPLRYAITWNARNIVMAGQKGATYCVNGNVKMVPHHETFQRSWAVEVEGLGPMEAYPNRDSLYYKKHYGLHTADTMIRGTLRYPGWCETWLQIVRLGVPNDDMRLPDSQELTYRDMTEMFLPSHMGRVGGVDARVAQFLGLNPTGKIMDTLRWLGLFSEKSLPSSSRTVAEAMTELLIEKLQLGPDDRDMVIILHQIEAQYPAQDNRRELITNTLVEFGSPGGPTAMSKTVGLPAGIASRLVLTGQLPITGCQIATHPMVHAKVLAALEGLGVVFTETREAHVEDQG